VVSDIGLLEPDGEEIARLKDLVQLLFEQLRPVAGAVRGGDLVEAGALLAGQVGRVLESRPLGVPVADRCLGHVRTHTLSKWC
jgi:hypothetical protein